MHMEEIDNYVDQEISFFNKWIKFRTVTKLVVFKNSSKNIEKYVNMKASVFSQTKTTIFVRAVTRRRYILAKLKVSKLGETLTYFKANYDYQIPTAFHDDAVIQQLNNDTFSLVTRVIFMEAEFSTQESVKMPVSVDIKVQTVEERVGSTPRTLHPVLMRHLW